MKVIPRNYGSIPHLPGSRRGPADRGVNQGQYRIACEKPRDGHDQVFVQEKLDGSNVGVLFQDDRLWPIQRSGYLASSSPHLQHHMFALWVERHEDQFRGLLHEGERVCGEWLVQAHGTRYELDHEPFVAFDLMRDTERVPWAHAEERLECNGFIVPYLLHKGGPCSIAAAMETLGDYGHHGALDPAEGCIWRIERKGKVDFLAKYVRPDKPVGCYLPGCGGSEEVWNRVESED